MELELLSKTPAKANGKPPVLFIHGAYACAQIWEPYFLPYFADRGYAAHAVSLRGHGNSDGHAELFATRFQDYLADVIAVAERLPEPPVMVGTSMGGLLVQKYMREQHIPAAVLLASAPPHGTLPSAIRLAYRFPLVALDMAMLQNFGSKAATVDMARRALFRDGTPDEYIETVLPKVGSEPYPVILDTLFLDLPPSSPFTETPVLVLGGSDDPFVSPEAMEITAKTYGTTAEIIPDLPHAVMLDHDWRIAADRIAAWLDETLPTSS